MADKKMRNILVVDNSPVILKLVSHALEREGHKVATAENGLEALKILESFKPDAIVTDLIMPKISGDIFCQIIRSRKEYNDVLLVVLSAVAAEEEFNYKAFGVDVCIAKGPAQKMCQHVLYALKHYQAGTDHQGNDAILGMDGIYKREITTELLSAKRHFEITLEHMTDGFVEMTTAAQIIYANKQAEHFFNRSREELVSSIFYNLFPKKLQLRLARYVKKPLNGPIDIGEDEIIMVNGLRVLMKFIPVREAEQESMIVLVSDISQRKELEQLITNHLRNLEETISLRTREYLNINKILHDEIKKHAASNEELIRVIRQLEAVLDSSQDLIAVLDCHMKIIRVNVALAEAYHSSPASFIGKHCDTLIQGDAAHSEEWPHTVAAQENRIASHLIEHYLPGKAMYVSCIPIQDDGGTCVGYVQIAREIR